MMKRSLFLATLALAAHAVVFANETAYGLPRVNIGRTPTYVHENKVYLAARPFRDDLKIFSVLKVATIVDLSGTMNVEAVEAAGFHYVRVPLRAGGPSGLDDVAPVVDILAEASRSERVLVCDDDGQLIGAVWALYRALGAGLDADEALEEGRTVGLEDKALVKRVRSLVSLSVSR